MSAEVIKNSATLILRSFHSFCAIATPSLCALSGANEEVSIDRSCREDQDGGGGGEVSYGEINPSLDGPASELNSSPSVADHVLGALYALSAGASSTRRDAIKESCRDFLISVENQTVANEIANAVLEHIEVMMMMMSR